MLNDSVVSKTESSISSHWSGDTKKKTITSTIYYKKKEHNNKNTSTEYTGWFVVPKNELHETSDF